MYCRPYRDTSLNVLQGTLLFLTWLTFQFGLTLQYSDTNYSGVSFQYIILVANVGVVVCPIIVGIVVVFRMVRTCWFQCWRVCLCACVNVCVRCLRCVRYDACITD